MTDIIKTEFVEALLPEEHPGDIEQKWHGRLRAKDSRSGPYRMAAPRTDRTHRIWLVPDKLPGWDVPLDQGPNPHCVEYMCTHLLLAHRIVNTPNYRRGELYDRAQELDEWPGKDYAGTSVNAGMKALREKGHIQSWGWANEVEAVVRHLLEVSPVAMGTDWTAEMDETDGEGYIWPRGPIVGGHAYLAIGVNRKRLNPDGTIGAIRYLNSWGPWGHKHRGRMWMTFGATQALLDGIDPRWRGDAVAPIEI